MPSLENRIAELETKMGGTDGEPDPLFVHFVGVDGNRPMARIERGHGEWLAQAGETDETFKARVRKEDDSPAQVGCARLYLCY